ncbi:Putative protein without homology [Lacticaseibacillus rhamnosus GG]|nr:Putative protein without homology [Lacticaseibacillus rhamnosus GG]
MFRLTPITRSPAQKSACKDLSRNGQRPAIATEAAYVPAYSHNAPARAHSKTASIPVLPRDECCNAVPPKFTLPSQAMPQRRRNS